jgi:hypothetical protein
MPRVRELPGAAFRNLAVEEGLAGMTPGSPAPYLAIGHLHFDSVMPHVAPLLADIPNFTSCQPTFRDQQRETLELF